MDGACSGLSFWAASMRRHAAATASHTLETRSTPSPRYSTLDLIVYLPKPEVDEEIAV
jgi:hypothetical protein